MLLDMLKKKKTGTWKNDNEINANEKAEQDKAKEAIENMYDKYFANSPLNISTGEFSDYIYTGVDTIGGKGEGGDTGEEYAEIYVRIDVLNKENYKKSKGKSCSIASDDLVNTYKNLELANSEIPLNSAFRMYDINSIANAIEETAEKQAAQKGGLKGGYTYKRNSMSKKSTSRRSTRRRTK